MSGFTGTLEFLKCRATEFSVEVTSFLKNTERKGINALEG